MLSKKSEGDFFELTLATKRITPCERVLKTVLENGIFFVYHSVSGHLGILKDVVGFSTNFPRHHDLKTKS